MTSANRRDHHNLHEVLKWREFLEPFPSQHQGRGMRKVVGCQHVCSGCSRGTQAEKLRGQGRDDSWRRCGSQMPFGFCGGRSLLTARSRCHQVCGEREKVRFPQATNSWSERSRGMWPTRSVLPHTLLLMKLVETQQGASLVIAASTGNASTYTGQQLSG